MDVMKILIDDACYAYKEIFGDFGEVTAVAGRDICPHLVKEVDILIVRSRTKVNQQLLSGSKVRFVGSSVAGLEHIDLHYLAKNNIKFFSAQGCNAMAVAEFVIQNILNLAQDLGFNSRTKTLGIIGVGNVGSRLANKAKLLGIKTLLNDPIRQKKEGLKNFVDLETALSADIITFHTPLTTNGSHPSYHLLNQHNCHLINKNSIIFNAARGGVIDEKIWQQVTTLANVIDCWENEPNINLTLQNQAYLATPHIAGHSIDAKFQGSFMVYEALCTFLKKPQNPAIKNLIKIDTLNIDEKDLPTTLNAIYDFKQDAQAIKKIGFETYRRNYPPRYEWHHYQSNIKLPIC
jgi:erythronate-4-phosphate dehydrogenase